MNTQIESIPTRLELDRLTYKETEIALERIMKLLSFVASRSDSINMSNIANSSASLLLSTCHMEKENSAFQHNLKELRNQMKNQDIKNLELEAQLMKYKRKK